MPDDDEGNVKEPTTHWSEKAAQTVVDITDTLREKGISPIYRIARWVVYGLLAAVIGVVILVLLLIALVRLLTDYVFASHVWLTYFALGIIFSIVGSALWMKRVAKVRE